jgi:hypothetical protein
VKRRRESPLRSAEPPLEHANMPSFVVWVPANRSFAARKSLVV